MRLQSIALSRAACRYPSITGRTLYGVRSFVATTQTNPLRRKTYNNVLNLPKSAEILQQKRWITQAWLARQEAGRQEWAKHAEEIKQGTRKSFVEHLEERGLLHDVVGYVNYPSEMIFAWD